MLCENSRERKIRQLPRVENDDGHTRSRKADTKTNSNSSTNTNTIGQ